MERTNMSKQSMIKPLSIALGATFAASLAAGYSKGKDAGKVEVIVAQGRDVKKPKGARPGLVTVGSYRSVMVVPARLSE